jgi:hypothetical protein
MLTKTLASWQVKFIEQLEIRLADVVKPIASIEVDPSPEYYAVYAVDEAGCKFELHRSTNETGAVYVAEFIVKQFQIDVPVNVFA